MLQVVTGRRYLRGFIGNPSVESAWLDEKVRSWLYLVETIAGVEYGHLQAAYAGLQKYLQQEWDFSSASPWEQVTPAVQWRTPSGAPSSQASSRS